jgi:hypothetical protein
MKKNNLNNLLVINLTKQQKRGFSKSSIKLRLPRPIIPESVPMFHEHTHETYRFIDEMLMRNYEAVAELDNHIAFHTFLIDRLKMDDIDNTQDIFSSIRAIGQDIDVRNDYLESALILEVISIGDQPPINYKEGWLSLLDDLDNTDEPGLDGLRTYVSTIYADYVSEQLIDNAVEEIHDDITPTVENPDNNQYENSLNDENIESSNEAEGSHLTSSEGDNNSASNPEDKTVKDSSSVDKMLTDDAEDFSDSFSLLFDNAPANGQGLNTSNNPSDVYNQSENNDKSSEVDNNSASNPEDKTVKDSSSVDKMLTDDAEDFSDSFSLLFDEQPEDHKSTIDFVLQKQQEEMPDIVDSDGGD